MRRPPALFPALLALSATVANAASHCSFERSYPEVASFEVVDGRLVAVLGGRYAPREAGAPAIRLVLDDTGTWRTLANETAGNTAATAPAGNRTTTTTANVECPAAPIDEAWIRAEGMNPATEIGFQQQTTACATNGPVEWGALAFSTIDGTLGGGLFEHAADTDDFEFWRPIALARYSINVMAFARDALWFGTTQEGECTGTTPGFGIYRIDVLDPQRRSYAYPEAGVCGFTARDMVVHDGTLWIATELGLAKLERTSRNGNVWQNFLPDPSSIEPMRALSCDEIYETVLNMPNMFTDQQLNLGYAFDDFWKRLSTLRPEFVARYLRKLHGR